MGPGNLCATVTTFLGPNDPNGPGPGSPNGPGAPDGVSITNGFWGIISDQPFSAITFLVGNCDNGETNCSFDSTVTNLQLSTTPAPAPEPRYWPIFLALAAGGIGLQACRLTSRSGPRTPAH